MSKRRIRYIDILHLT